MKTYKEFRPTSFDTHISMQDREEWLVLPCGTNRDADLLTESNFATACELLKGQCGEPGGCDDPGQQWEIHRFGHWACGWFEIILVKPDTEAHKVADEIQSDLENYLVLNEDDHTEHEQEAAQQVWKDCYTDKQRLAYIRNNGGQFQFRMFQDLMACVKGRYFGGYASELLG
jgi:hypothetical protein